MKLAKSSRYSLRLFVTGATPRSTSAITRVKAICEKHLRGRYLLEIIDIYQQPELAVRQQIIAVPALVKEEPSPRRLLIGDLSNTDSLLSALQLAG